MDIANKKVVKEYSKNKKGEITEDELTEKDVVFEQKEKGKTQKYKLGGLNALDLNFRDYYDIHAENPDVSFKNDAVPMLKWLSIVCDAEVDFELAKKQGRKKGDGKGPWPSSWKDNKYTEHYIIFTNDIVNKGFFELQNHPKLQWQLMSMVGIGEVQNHQWLPLATRKKNTNKLDNLFLKFYPNANNQELKILKNLNTKQDIEELAKRAGFSDNEIKEITKEVEAWQNS